MRSLPKGPALKALEANFHRCFIGKNKKNWDVFSKNLRTPYEVISCLATFVCGLGFNKKSILPFQKIKKHLGIWPWCQHPLVRPAARTSPSDLSNFHHPKYHFYPSTMLCIFLQYDFHRPPNHFLLQTSREFLMDFQNLRTLTLQHGKTWKIFTLKAKKAN